MKGPQAVGASNLELPDPADEGAQLPHVNWCITMTKAEGVTAGSTSANETFTAPAAGQG